SDWQKEVEAEALAAERQARITEGREQTLTVPMPAQTVPPQRRNPLVIPGILGGVIVAGAAAAYFALRSPEQPPVAARPQPPVVATPQPQVAKVEPQPAPQPQVDEKAQREAAAKAEQAKKQEAARLAAEEEAKKKEAAKLAEEEKKKESARLAAEKKEAAKLADAKKKEEAARLAAEEAKKKEAVAAAKAAEEAKKKEEAARLAAAAEEAKKKEAARLAAEEAKKKEAAAAAAAAAKAAEEQKRQQVAAVAAAAAVETKRANGPELFARASELESQGKVAEAVKLYVAAANADHGPAAKKLGDIYSGGKGDVSQDYTASLRWYQRARQLGEKITVKGRYACSRAAPCRLQQRGALHPSAGEGPELGEEDLGQRRPPVFVVPALEHLAQVQARVAERRQPDGLAIRLDVGARALGGGDQVVAARVERQTIARHHPVVPPPVVDEHVAVDIAEPDHRGRSIVGPRRYAPPLYTSQRSQENHESCPAADHRRRPAGAQRDLRRLARVVHVR